MTAHCSASGGGFWARFGVEKGALAESEAGKGNRQKCLVVGGDEVSEAAREGSPEVMAEPRLGAPASGRSAPLGTQEVAPPLCFQGGAPTPFDRNYGTKLGMKAMLWMSEKLQAVYRKGTLGEGGPDRPCPPPGPGCEAAGMCLCPQVGCSPTPPTQPA